jgi:hypothetical protein
MNCGDHDYPARQCHIHAPVFLYGLMYVTPSAHRITPDLRTFAKFPGRRLGGEYQVLRLGA